jgi:thiosulfate dehydrogenase
MNQPPTSSAPRVEHSPHQAPSANDETHALLWFAGLVVLLLLIALAVFGVKIIEMMRPAPDAAAPTRVPVAAPAAPATPAATARAVGFQPPADDTIPHTPMGDMIRKGQQIFMHTGANAKAFVGNSLNCVNCHLDAGRRAHSAPMWGAYLLYPAYRGKTKHVDTFAERLRGCFMYSMNGKAPPLGDEVLVALESYAYWMATGAPVGERLPGAGLPTLAQPAQPPTSGAGKRSSKRTARSATAPTARASAPATPRPFRRCGARSPSTGARAWPTSIPPPPSSRPTCRSARAAP